MRRARAGRLSCSAHGIPLPLRPCGSVATRRENCNQDPVRRHRRGSGTRDAVARGRRASDRQGHQVKVAASGRASRTWPSSSPTSRRSGASSSRSSTARWPSGTRSPRTSAGLSRHPRGLVAGRRAGAQVRARARRDRLRGLRVPLRQDAPPARDLGRQHPDGRSLPPRRRRAHRLQARLPRVARVHLAPSSRAPTTTSSRRSSGPRAQGAHHAGAVAAARRGARRHARARRAPARVRPHQRDRGGGARGERRAGARSTADATA